MGNDLANVEALQMVRSWWVRKNFEAEFTGFGDGLNEEIKRGNKKINWA